MNFIYLAFVDISLQGRIQKFLKGGGGGLCTIVVTVNASLEGE